MTLHVIIPANTTAQVHLEGVGPDEVAEGGLPLFGRDGVHSVLQSDNDLIVEVGSGDYTFEYRQQDRAA